MKFLPAIFFILIGFGFNRCTDNAGKKRIGVSKAGLSSDSSDYAVIAFDEKQGWPFAHTTKPTTLSQQEIEIADSIMIRCISDYNQKLDSDRRQLYSIDFNRYKYKRQYIAVINEKGEKLVWVNGFCNPIGIEWKTKIVAVDDGGNCFFNLKINLNTKECFEILVNGYA